MGFLNRNCIVVLGCFTLLVATVYYSVNKVNFDINTVDNVYLLNNFQEVPDYKQLDFNKFKLDVAQVSNMVINLNNIGYEVEVEILDDKYIDIKAEGLDDTFRLVYEVSTGFLTCSSSDFGKISVLSTYISEERYNDMD